MERYDYREAVKRDVLNYMENEIEFEDFRNLEDLGQYLNDKLQNDDSVTGNESGSYTFNTWEAEENICHNLDLLGEALNEFGYSFDYIIENGAEGADVAIRCYLLSECIEEAMKEIESDFEERKDVGI